MSDGHVFSLFGAELTARASGVLWWAHRRILCVSDLHLGKSDRLARRSGIMMPPYETADTLLRLQSEIEALAPQIVICLGDSFDDLQASDSLDPAESACLYRMQAGRQWIWIEGNHDPGPVEFSGAHLAEYRDGPLVFRHIAETEAEVSGHYHPKAAVPLGRRRITRPCFLYDQHRVILPAFGTFTGGLRSDATVLQGLMRPGAVAVLTGQTCHVLPMPRG
jgi:DNA ligase-associated metallophosphoesterase